jgi:hypothetical protein
MPMVDNSQPQNPDDQFKQGNLDAINGIVQNVFVRVKENAEKQAKLDMMKMSADPIKGTVSVTDMPLDLMNEFVEARKNMAGITAQYDKMIGDIDTKKRRAASGSPWGDVLATIAASMAANDPNPYTRGIGQAAKALNPTQRELDSEKLPILKAKQSASESRLGMAEGEARVRGEQSRTSMEGQRIGMERERIRIERQRETRESRDAFLRPYMSAAEKGNLPNKAELASGLLSRGLASSVDEAMAQAAQIESFAKSAQTERTRERKEAFSLTKSMLETKDSMKRGYAQFVDSLHQQSAKAKDVLKQFSTILPAQQTDLINSSSLDQNIQFLKEKFKDPAFQKYMGASQTVIQQLPYVMQPEDAFKVQTFLSTELPQVIKEFSAGARGFAKSEQPVFTAISGAATMTPQQLMDRLDNMERILTQKRRAIMLAKPEADWTKAPQLLGPQVYKEWEATHAQRPDVGGSTSGPKLKPNWIYEKKDGTKVRTDAQGNITN